MATKHKARTYGRRRGNDLVASFDTLSISPLPLSNTKAIIESKTLENAIPQVDVLSPCVKEINCGLENGTTTDLPTESLTQKRSGTNTTTAREREPLKAIHTGQEQPKRRGRKPKAQKTQISDHHEPTPPRRHEDGKQSPSLTSVKNSLPGLNALLSLPYVHPTISDFSTQYDIWARTFTFAKIAQGSYASILRLSLTSNPDVYTIWKLMPLKSSSGKGSRLEGGTIFEDAIAEVKLLEAMSKSPGFVEFRSAQVLRGEVPEGLRVVEECWEKGLTRKEREDLGEKRNFGDEQVWLFIEMTDAGMDLETWFKERRSDFQRRIDVDGYHPDDGHINIFEAWDIFWGIVEALAHGEEHSEFEHRDLHPGNVCVKIRKMSASADSSLEERQSLVRRYNELEVTLIDYTLSRAAIQTPSNNTEDEDSRIGMREILANSMRDKAIFTQQSENTVDQMQYNTYRHMRKIMHHHHVPAKRKEGWQSFMPMTNVLWLHHILTIILKETGMYNQKWDVIAKVLDAAQAKAVFRLADIREAIEPKKMLRWEYGSATELLEAEILEEVGLS